MIDDNWKNINDEIPEDFKDVLMVIKKSLDLYDMQIGYFRHGKPAVIGNHMAYNIFGEVIYWKNLPNLPKALDISI